MSKTRKVFSTLLGTLLLVAVGSGTAVAVFVFTDAGPYLFGSKTVIESKDEENKSRLDQTNKQLSEVDLEIKTLIEQGGATKSQIEAAKTETKEVQKTLEGVKAANAENKKKAKTFTSLKNTNTKNLKQFQDKFDKMQPLQTHVLRARNAFHNVQALLRKITEQEGKLNKHARIVAIKFLEVQRAAKYNWSYIKEFFIYTLGLKILWGIFTGYKANTSTYYSQLELDNALAQQERARQDLSDSLEELQVEYRNSYNALTEALKNAEQQAHFDTKLKEYISKEIKEVFVKSLKQWEEAKAEYDLATKLLDLKIIQFVGRKSLTKEEAKQLEENLQRLGGDVYTIFQTALENLKGAKVTFENTLVELENKFNVLVSDKINLSQLKQSLEFHKEKQKLFDQPQTTNKTKSGGVS